MAQGSCNVDGCDRGAEKRGWCSMHYKRWRRTGDPTVVRKRPGRQPTDEASRFWVKVNRQGPILDPGLGRCWEWTAHTDKDGYGIFFSTSNVRAHRWAWEDANGPIPDDLPLDHLCRNRSCVNPDHLEPVTHAENILRGGGLAAINAIKTHCKRGHPLIPANTYVYADGRRSCRTCMRKYHQERRANGFR